MWIIRKGGMKHTNIKILYNVSHINSQKQEAFLWFKIIKIK